MSKAKHTGYAARRRVIIGCEMLVYPPAFDCADQRECRRVHRYNSSGCQMPNRSQLKIHPNWRVALASWVVFKAEAVRVVRKRKFRYVFPATQLVGGQAPQIWLSPCKCNGMPKRWQAGPELFTRSYDLVMHPVASLNTNCRPACVSWLSPAFTFPSLFFLHKQRGVLELEIGI